jgi:chemotaxis signal transduction protein
MGDSTKHRNTKTRLTMSALPMEFGEQDPGDVKSDLVSVLMFDVGGAQYAIGVENTEGVVDCPRITPLPGPPEGVAGLASVRGRMTIVMDLSQETSQEPAKRRLILVKGDAQLGLLADRVEGVLALEPKNVRPVAHGKYNLTAERAKFDWPARSYFKRGRQRIPILDIERLSEA